MPHSRAVYALLLSRPSFFVSHASISLARSLARSLSVSARAFVCMCVYIHLSCQSAEEEASWELMNGQDKLGMTELRSLKQPPDAIKDVAAGVLVLMAQDNIPDLGNSSWKEHSCTVLRIVALHT